MSKLTEKIRRLKQSEIGDIVRKRLEEFSSFRHKTTEEWFSELCFCLLTANSKARSAIEIQKELGTKGFCERSALEIKECIQRHRHRFHNNKTGFIVGARSFVDIKHIVRHQVDAGSVDNARKWLVENIKGLGYKEASHFLRNVGYFDVAILDRHVLNILAEEGYIKEKPKQLTKRKYLEIEKIVGKIADDLGMSQAELDLYLWYMKGGEVLK